jgi:tRNA:m4X modification enzyme
MSFLLFLLFIQKKKNGLLLWGWCGFERRIVVCRKLPFQEKHVMQQASILGNLEEIEVLKNAIGREQCDSEEAYEDEKNGVPAVVEFGAGRGYLTQMLADCYGIKRVFLVERKSYKLKVSWVGLACFLH